MLTSLRRALAGEVTSRRASKMLWLSEVRTPEMMSVPSGATVAASPAAAAPLAMPTEAPMHTQESTASKGGSTARV